MTDLQIAKDNLTGYTICLCKDGSCLYSQSRGISPMMDFIDSGVDLTGYSVADIVVGKAVALLFVKCGIKSVFAKTLSQNAQKIFELFGVEYAYEVLTEKIINRLGTDICPMEKAVANINEPQEAYEVLKVELNRIRANKNN